jgi:hypothetical protein
MNEYIIFINEQEAIDLINQINTCMGWPSDGTTTWMENPNPMCEFDLQTGDKISIGYGIIITDRVIDCLNPTQLSEVFSLPSNINTCSWNHII